MTADKELLELAAKAVGMEYPNGKTYCETLGVWGMLEKRPYHWWNPLTDDGDALRLAVKTHQLQNNRWMRHLNLDDYKKDPYAATRRAIVRAAAAIGAAIGAEK